jgi:hypothetical protein
VPSATPRGAETRGGGAGGAFLWVQSGFAPRCTSWLVDDIYGFFAGSPALQTVIQGSAGPLGNASGDYLETREHPTHKNTFVTSCFAYEGTTGSGVRNRVAWHGRSRDFPSSVRGVTELQPPTGTLPHLGLPAELRAEVLSALVQPRSPLDSLSLSLPLRKQGGDR